MLKKIWLGVCRAVFGAFISAHGYRVKSWSYRYAFEKKYLSYPVREYHSLADLVKFVQTLEWVADSWEQLFDAISYPEKVEYVGYYGDKKVGDCDEFAVYLAAAINKSPALPVGRAQLLTVIWVDAKNKPGGHNVCLLRSKDDHWGYMDYGPPRYYTSLREVVDAVVARYGKDGAECCGWAVSDPATLAPLEVHWS